MAISATRGHWMAVRDSGRPFVLGRRADTDLYHILSLSFGGEPARPSRDDYASGFKGRPFSLCRKWGQGPWFADYEGRREAHLCAVCWDTFESPERTFRDIESFYAADERRRYSGERDFGFHWRGEDPAERWHVGYVQDTGEVYARRMSSEAGAQGPSRGGLVRVLGVVPAGDGCAWAGPLETALRGWLEQCWQPGGLSWVRDRLADPGRVPE